MDACGSQNLVLLILQALMTPALNNELLPAPDCA
jgi:hypothetical protein